MKINSENVISVARKQLRYRIVPGAMVNAELFDDVIRVIVEALVNEINYQLNPERIIAEANTELIERASILLAERISK